MTRLALLSLAAALGAAAVPLLAQPPADANRDAFYCDERKLGSWFYCNSEEAKRRAREQAMPASPAIPATERMAQITAKLDELKARAILEPTSENIVSYIRFQREQLDRASTFADVWGRSIWQNPISTIRSNDPSRPSQSRLGRRIAKPSVRARWRRLPSATGSSISTPHPARLAEPFRR